MLCNSRRKALHSVETLGARPYNPEQSRPGKTALTGRGRREPPVSLPSEKMQRQLPPATSAADTASPASAYTAVRGGAAIKIDQLWCSHSFSTTNTGVSCDVR